MAERSGRNDPCPCCSGKKYKRCCLGDEPPRPLPTKGSIASGAIALGE